MISVIIPTYKNPKYLDLCLKSIVDNKVSDTTEVIVVVDGFVEESEYVMQKYSGISYLPLESNMGMQYAINIGVMQANNPYVFIVNDDNVFPTKWDSRLEEVITQLETTEPKFALTVNQIEPTGPGMFNFPSVNCGTMVDTFDLDKFLATELQYQSNNITKDGHIFPFIVNKKYFMGVGGFDTFYDSPNICDWDFFLKLELLDFTFPRTHSVHLYHFGSVSTKKNAESQSFVLRERNAMEQYIWKWGSPPYNQPGVNSKIPPNKQFRGFRV